MKIPIGYPLFMLLQDQLELSKRENIGLLERERQLQLKVKSLQNCVKNEKEEVIYSQVLFSRYISHVTLTEHIFFY